jgi:hypothetical protein
MCVTTKNDRECSYWAEMVEPLLDDDVEVRGECDQEQKAEFLARARALLFPIQWLDPHVMRARVKELFSAEAMVAGYERIYQRVLASGDGASRALGT